MVDIYKVEAQDHLDALTDRQVEALWIEVVGKNGPHEVQVPFPISTEDWVELLACEMICRGLPLSLHPPTNKS